MSLLTYEEFVEAIEKYKILPFAGFVPDYPSLTAMASNNDWHTGSETDPWPWRVRVVQDGVAAYGKFFGDKACFIQTDFFPVVRSVLSSNKTVEERYRDGLLSRSAYNLYQVLLEHGNIDTRNLRKAAGLNAKESKKEYEKSLVELQNYGDAVITGAVKRNDDESGWSSMRYQPSEEWLSSVRPDLDNLSSEEAKNRLATELFGICSEKSLKFFAKKLG